MGRQKEVGLAKKEASSLTEQLATSARKLVELRAQVESLQSVAEWDLKVEDVSWQKLWAQAAAASVSKQLQVAEAQLSQALKGREALTDQVQQVQTELATALAPPDMLEIRKPSK